MYIYIYIGNSCRQHVCLNLIMDKLAGLLLVLVLQPLDFEVPLAAVRLPQRCVLLLPPFVGGEVAPELLLKTNSPALGPGIDALKEPARTLRL